MSANEKRRGASHTVTSTEVDQDRRPIRFFPLKRAPTAGPAAPLLQVPPRFSGDQSPIRGRSVTIAHTFSAGAAISQDTDTTLVMSQCRRLAGPPLWGCSVAAAVSPAARPALEMRMFRSELVTAQRALAEGPVAGPAGVESCSAIGGQRLVLRARHDRIVLDVRPRGVDPD